MKYDVCIIGGCGHVGLPLAICFAREGKNVAICDVNESAAQAVASGIMPFKEENGEELLKEALAEGRLGVTCDPAVISESEALVFILGTPLDEHLNPTFSVITNAVKKYSSYLRNSQLLVLRSTVYPGTTERIHRLLQEQGLDIDVAFCPERVAEGHAIRETYDLPQIVSGVTEKALSRARSLFSAFTQDIIEVKTQEAELAKLFSNAWRYLKFAAANEFYRIANEHGLDYYRIREAMTHNYPRAKDLPGAGLAAGPCLVKDTMQLAAYSGNTFFLGHAAMMVNEGQPGYIVECLKRRHNLREAVVGVLGMAFKAESDDHRSSLAYKLRKILEIECKQALITDPYVKDERIVPVEDVIERSDILIIGAPHRAYKDLDLNGKTVVDIWNFYGRGGLIT